MAMQFFNFDTNYIWTQVTPTYLEIVPLACRDNVRPIVILNTVITLINAILERTNLIQVFVISLFLADQSRLTSKIYDIGALTIFKNSTSMKPASGFAILSTIDQPSAVSLMILQFS